MEPYSKNLVMIIDGTSAPILHPQVTHRDYWVHYKRHHAFRYFVVTLADGRTVYVSTARPGNVTDEREYNESGLRELLENTYPIGRAPPGYSFVLGGDKVY